MNEFRQINPRTKNLSPLPSDLMEPTTVEVRLTRKDGGRAVRLDAAEMAPRGPILEIEDVLVLDPQTTYQEMLGFGGTIIDSDVSNLLRLAPEQRRAAIAALVGPDGLGFNLMRIGFGSTDWNRDWDFYTYCDLPPGETDPALAHFSLQRDIDRGVIGVIREFFAVNPDLKLLASVWAVPAWMKTNGSLIHGRFDSASTDVYADYLVRSVEAYAELGIPIHYLTVQNEPGTGDDRATPAAMWTWQQCRDVLKALGPRLRRAGMQTELWVHDHNFDMAQTYAKPLLDDPEVKALAGAVAFHDYRGRPEEMTLLMRQHPDVPAIITERNRGSLADMKRLLDCLNAGASGHISWTTVADEWGGPHQYDGGSGKTPPRTDYENQGNILVVPLRQQPPAWYRPLVYDCYALLTPYVQRGARRIAISPIDSEACAVSAFANLDGTTAVALVNSGDRGLDLCVQKDGTGLLLHLPAESMVSLHFRDLGHTP